MNKRFRSEALILNPSLADEVTQLGASAVNLSLDSTHRKAELLGNLLVREILEEAQLDETTIFRCHHLKVLFKLRLALGADDSLLGIRSERSGLANVFTAGTLDRNVVAALTNVVDEGVFSDSVNPLAESVRTVVTI